MSEYRFDGPFVDPTEPMGVRIAIVGVVAVAVVAAFPLASGAMRAGVGPVPTAAVRAELADIVGDLRRADLPADLVANKVLEGLAKRVPTPRILAAARGLSNEIILVSRVMFRHAATDRAHRHELIRAGVAAHMAGLPLDGVDQIVGSAIGAERAAAVAGLYAAADLRGYGYPSAPTIQVVVALLGRAAPTRDLERALAVIESARQRAGSPADEVIGQIAVAVGNGADLAAAAKTITGNARRP